jgi:hypothetical protein
MTDGFCDFTSIDTQWHPTCLHHHRGTTTLLFENSIGSTSSRKQSDARLNQNQVRSHDGRVLTNRKATCLYANSKHEARPNSAAAEVGSGCKK